MGIEIDTQNQCHIDSEVFPAIGFGTYPHQGEVCESAVRQALSNGYRIIDTATFYGNFVPIGKAIHQFGRDKVYIISKVWPDAHTPELLQRDIEKTLSELRIDKLDAYLLHWPNSRVPIEATFNTLNKMREDGLIRHIGLSNVTIHHIKRALELEIPISWVQVEMHPHFYDASLLAMCKQHSIVIQAWSPLGRGKVLQDEQLVTIGKKYGKSSSQISLKWILQHGCLPLPSSTNPDHIKQNQDVFDFTLTDGEMHAIDSQAVKGERYRLGSFRGLGFSDEFDYSYAECWPQKQ